MARRGARLIVVCGVAMMLVVPGSAWAARVDAAPIPADVVQRVVPSNGKRPPTIAEVVERHLEAAGSLLAQMEEEGRNFGGRDGDPAARTMSASLLAAKAHEL